MGWPHVALGDIFTIARGGSPRPIDAFITDDPNGVNWIMIGDATEGSKYISSTKKRIRNQGVSRSRAVKPGDFLLTNSMSFGRPYILGTHGCIHDGWLVLSPRTTNVDKDYFYHLLGSTFVYAQFARLAAGAVVKNLNSELVRGVKVPFPPLSEQRRIADILDKADAIRRKRKEAIALTEELLRSTFLEMFGDPVTNPKGWPVKALGDAVELFAGNSLPPGVEFTGQEGGYFLLKVGDMNTRGNEVEIVAAREWAATVPAASIVAPPGAVVIPKRGGAIATNKKRVLTRPAALDPNLMAIAPGPSITLDYLRQWFEGVDLSTLSNGSTVPQLNKKDLTPLSLAVPSREAQSVFSRFAARARALRAREEMALADTDFLFAGLLGRAFSESVIEASAC